mmetsp:Transcript_31959/g.52758  ORF Transcript_31959/g.52758 Transcript_31959/m.52758 type:complete len:216 (+) Transcript_31959:99-746(+)
MHCCFATLLGRYSCQISPWSLWEDIVRDINGMSKGMLFKRVTRIRLIDKDNGLMRDVNNPGRFLIIIVPFNSVIKGQTTVRWGFFQLDSLHDTAVKEIVVIIGGTSLGVGPPLQTWSFLDILHHEETHLTNILWIIGTLLLGGKSLALVFLIDIKCTNWPSFRNVASRDVGIPGQDVSIPRLLPFRTIINQYFFSLLNVTERHNFNHQSNVGILV